MSSIFTKSRKILRRTQFYIREGLSDRGSVKLSELRPYNFKLILIIIIIVIIIITAKCRGWNTEELSCFYGDGEGIDEQQWHTFLTVKIRTGHTDLEIRDIIEMTSIDLVVRLGLRAIVTSSNADSDHAFLSTSITSY